MSYTKNNLKTGNKIEEKHFTNIDNALDANDKAITALQGKTGDANTSTKGIVKQATNVAKATGPDNVTKAEFDALIDALIVAGIMAAS